MQIESSTPRILQLKKKTNNQYKKIYHICKAGKDNKSQREMLWIPNKILNLGSHIICT